jgi:succinoglycan biosynthesis protein ExoM
MKLSKKVRIAIGLCTYKRPQMVGKCIASLQALRCPPDWELVIVLVDNDPGSSVKSGSIHSGSTDRYPVHYFVEPQRGIPNARNRACQEAVALGAQFLLFIDDDEEAEPEWLNAYREAMAQFEAEAYTGPVRYRFPPGFEDWLGNKGFAGTKRGTLLKRASTNNALVDIKRAQDLGFVFEFDTHMTMSGGSDTEFFMRLVQAGGRIVYVDNAIVSEEVVTARLTIRWRLKRQYQSSANRIYIESKLFGGQKTTQRAAKEVFRHAIEGLLRVISSPLLLLAGYSKFKRGWYHGLRHFAKGAGILAGLRGRNIQLYLKTDGH